MNINHEPIFEVDKIIEHYSMKDGVDIKYVCTSSVQNDTIPVDIFYRETPHPEFGNKYLGLYANPFDDRVFICNADHIEELDFVFAEDAEGKLHYSQHRHDFHQVTEEGAIDGGSYTRCVGTVKTTNTHRLKDGEFKEA
jgi:hypothetical protein